MSEISSKLKFAERLVGRGKISRREFVQLALAAGFTVAAADAMFIKAARAEPKKGGHFKMALEPRLHIGYPGSRDLFQSVHDGRYLGFGRQRPDRGRRGGQCRRPIWPTPWSPPTGRRSGSSSCASGVTFHNEKTVTSDDVVASYRHHMTEDTKSPSKSLLKAVKDIKTDGPETVIFELDGGNADFPYITSDIPIMPSADGKADWQSGVRTGAYVVEKFEPGVKTTLKKYPNYYRTDRGHFDSAEVLSIIDVAARTNALTSGEVHYIDRLDLKTLHLLKRNQSIKILEVVGYGHYIFAMNVTVPPFDNVDVRTALKYSLDREDIVKKVFLGHGKVGERQPDCAERQVRGRSRTEARLRPGEGQELSQEGGFRDAEGRPFGVGCGLRELRRCGCALEGACDQGRHRAQRDPRAQRWLLGQCVAEEALLRLVLGRPADLRLDVHPRLRGGRTLERHVLEASALQRAAHRRPLGDR